MKTLSMAIICLLLVSCYPGGLNGMKCPVVVVAVGDNGITLVDSKNNYLTVSDRTVLFGALKNDYQKGDTLIFNKDETLRN